MLLCAPASALTTFREAEPNNNIPQAQFLNTNDTEILVIGDRRHPSSDWYRIIGQRNSILNLVLRSSGGSRNRDPILGLFNSAGREIAFNDNFDGMGRDSAIRNFRLTATGTYYIAVSGFGDRNFRGGGAGSRGWDYNLSITRSTVPEPGEWAVIALSLAGVGGLLWRARTRRAALALP